MTAHLPENNYKRKALQELLAWQEEMQQPPSFLNNLARKAQHKINSYIPDKVHNAITAAIKQMTRATLFGANLITRQPATSHNLQLQEAQVLERINFYKNAAALEGGVTGAGGFLLGLADFPLLLGIKIKMLFEIAALYGYDVTDYKERIYLLHIFQLAFSSHEYRREVYLQITDWETRKQHLPNHLEEFDWRGFQQEYRDYIDLAKMAQLIPVIGAPVGAIVNIKLIRKLGYTAMNAYRLRWHEMYRL
ncbi:EcsC family protein [Pontibacter sp. KCTC 32443]|uniref:EcsC family protein n=1 Tax=Pontibacter TaxID=323449 RepID=UPI00164E6B8B|nr:MULTISPECIES: EcsC family protein [Pontibacter]MBC5772697.1 EcsC family protein [Pontibacter sp. KCTC 32443]